MESNPSAQPEGHETRAGLEQLTAEALAHAEIGKVNLDKLFPAYIKCEAAFKRAFDARLLSPGQTFLPLAYLAGKVAEACISSAATKAAERYFEAQRIYLLWVEPSDE